jgi:hypothetical protein
MFAFSHSSLSHSSLSHSSLAHDEFGLNSLIVSQLKASAGFWFLVVGALTGAVLLLAQL